MRRGADPPPPPQVGGNKQSTFISYGDVVFSVTCLIEDLYFTRVLISTEYIPTNIVHAE